MSGGPGPGWMIDPSAGVRLAPRIRECPRCGVEKGLWGQTRGGLCHDCVAVLPAAERGVWRRAA